MSGNIFPIFDFEETKKTSKNFRNNQTRGEFLKILTLTLIFSLLFILTD